MARRGLFSGSPPERFDPLDAVLRSLPVLPDAELRRLADGLGEEARRRGSALPIGFVVGELLLSVPLVVQA